MYTIVWLMNCPRPTESPLPPISKTQAANPIHTRELLEIVDGRGVHEAVPQRESVALPQRAAAGEIGAARALEQLHQVGETLPGSNNVNS